MNKMLTAMGTMCFANSFCAYFGLANLSARQQLICGFVMWGFALVRGK